MAISKKSKFFAASLSAAVTVSAVAPTILAAELPEDSQGLQDNEKEALALLMEAGVVKGDADTGAFRPGDSITRAEASSMLSAILELDVDNAPAADFPDVDQDAWYAKYVNAVAAEGIVVGDEEGNFNWDSSLTRAEFAQMVFKAYGLEAATAELPFEDLVEDAWYTDAIATLYADGLIAGQTDTTFGPNESIRRVDTARLLAVADLQHGTYLNSFVAPEVGSVSAVTDEETGLTTVSAGVTNFAEEDTATITVTPDAALEADDIVVEDVAIDEEGNVEYTFEEALPAGTHSVVVSVGDVASEAVEFTVEEVTPEVESVSAINAKQIEVKFNKTVSQATAEDENNYLVRLSTSVAATDLDALTTAEAELQADGKTVVITANGTRDIETAFGVQAGAVFEFIVDGVKTTDGTSVPKASHNLKVNDEVAPTFVSTSASAKTTTNQVTVTFSEPVVATSGVVKVNGSFGSVAPGSTPNSVTVTTGSNLEAGKSYEVEVLNFVDYAGNFLTPNPVKTTVTVSANIVAPVVTDVKVVRDNLLEVSFDKAMAPGTISKSTIKLLDGNYSDIASANITGVVAKANTGNKVFQISLDDSPALPFNNGSFTGTLVFTDSITDSVGNKLSQTTRSFTLTRDTVAPAVVSVKHVKANSAVGANYGGVSLAEGAIVVKFNESISKGTLTGLKLIDNNGVDVTSTYLTGTELTAAAVSSLDSTELVLPLATEVTTASGITSFTLRLVAGSTNDLSLDTNASTAAVNTFATVPGVSSTGDTTAPDVTGVTVGTGNVIQIAVTEAGSLDSSTVLNLNNYRIDGAPLPAGTYITVTGSAPSYTINLHLPGGSVSESRNYAVNVSGIKDTTGNTMGIKAFNTVALVDDVKPELKTAVLNTNGSLTIGYSEVLAGVIADSDLAVTLNGKVVDTGSVTAIAGTGSETGKDVVTVQVSVYDGGDSTYGDGNEVLYIDADGVAGYSAADDILISTGSYLAAVGGTDFNLNNATTLKIGTVASPVTADGDSNAIKGNTVITVK